MLYIKYYCLYQQCIDLNVNAEGQHTSNCWVSSAVLMTISMLYAALVRTAVMFVKIIICKPKMDNTPWLVSHLQDEQLTAVRASKPKRLPTVLSRSEALEVIKHLRGTNKLIAQIMYGSGLRVMETLRL